MPDAPPVPPAPFARSYFQCDNGERLDWRYFPVQGVVSIRLEGQNHELHPVPPTRQREHFAGYGVQAQLRGNTLRVNFLVQPRTLQCQRVQP